MENFVGTILTTLKFSTQKKRNKKPLIIYGKGGHSRVITDTVDKHLYKIIFVDDNNREILDSIPRNTEFFVAIGDNHTRAFIHSQLEIEGFRPTRIIHPTSWISSLAVIDTGTYIGPKAVVCANSYIGVGTIINTGATVDHDCHIEDFVHIAPGVNLCGGVRVGSKTLVGVGSTVPPYIKIGRECIVAGGSSIKDDVPSNTLVAGNPATHKRDL